jgi:formate--tetrahydrofolate ligase
VTEAGFGADLGAEKFLNIVCRKAEFKPEVIVVVATIRSLKMNGGVPKGNLATENLEALSIGLANLKQHIDNCQSFGVPVVVGLNRFTQDTKAEVELTMEKCADLGVEVVESTVWEHGSKGGLKLAEKVVEIIGKVPSNFHHLYEDSMPLWDKIETVAKKIYRAGKVETDKRVRNKLAALEKAGYGHLPVCMAKTQYSFSSDPTLLGAPEGFTFPVRDVRLAAGAEFVIVYCGDIMTMPGLPKIPAAEVIDVDEEGKITGLF